jgi:hypothetical protein
MDEGMQQFQQSIIELENEAEHLLLARNQVIENDKERNGNREALTALRKRAKTMVSEQIAETEEKTNTKLQKLIPNCRNQREDEIPKQLQRQNRNTKLQKLIPNCRNRREDEYQIAEADTKLQKPKRRRIPNCRS